MGGERGRASVSKEARLEACRDWAARRSSAESSAATSEHASVGRSSGGASPSSGGRKSVLRCSAASVRSACAHTPTASSAHAQLSVARRKVTGQVLCRHVD